MPLPLIYYFFSGTNMKNLKKVMLGFLILSLWLIPTSTLAAGKSYEGITFLDDVKKVEWYKIDGRHIIVGWKGLPDDFYQWNYKTAIKASKLSRQKVHVWSVRYNQKLWSPGEGGQICITTATWGRFEKTNCRKY
jgi:hypothetical protein